MRKFVLSLILSITFAFPAVRDGNAVFDLRDFYGVKQVQKFVLLLPKYHQEPVQLSFDNPFEANEFVDRYEAWLVGDKR